MLSAMKGSYFKLIAAKRVYSENQFYESPFSTKGSSMQLSNFEIMSVGAWFMDGNRTLLSLPRTLSSKPRSEVNLWFKSTSV